MSQFPRPCLSPFLAKIFSKIRLAPVSKPAHNPSQPRGEIQVEAVVVAQDSWAGEAGAVPRSPLP